MYCVYWTYFAYRADYLLFFLRMPASHYKSKRSSFSRSPQSRLSLSEVDDDDCDDEDSMTQLKRARTNLDGETLTKKGRVSIKQNLINAKYDSRYHCPENSRTLLGRLLTLGKACGLVAVAAYGDDVPMENAGHCERVQIFESAAFYALSDEELDEILAIDEKSLKTYLKGILTAGISIWQYIIPEEVHTHFESEIFSAKR
jgi:hypothetical protein